MVCVNVDLPAFWTHARTLLPDVSHGFRCLVSFRHLNFVFAQTILETSQLHSLSQALRDHVHTPNDRKKENDHQYGLLMTPYNINCTVID